MASAGGGAVATATAAGDEYEEERVAVERSAKQYQYKQEQAFRQYLVAARREALKTKTHKWTASGRKTGAQSCANFLYLAPPPTSSTGGLSRPTKASLARQRDKHAFSAEALALTRSTPFEQATRAAAETEKFLAELEKRASDWQAKALGSPFLRSPSPSPSPQRSRGGAQAMPRRRMRTRGAEHGSMRRVQQRQGDMSSRNMPLMSPIQRPRSRSKPSTPARAQPSDQASTARQGRSSSRAGSRRGKRHPPLLKTLGRSDSSSSLQSQRSFRRLIKASSFRRGTPSPTLDSARAKGGQVSRWKNSMDGAGVSLRAFYVVCLGCV